MSWVYYMSDHWLREAAQAVPVDAREAHGHGKIGPGLSVWICTVQHHIRAQHHARRAHVHTYAHIHNRHTHHTRLHARICDVVLAHSQHMPSSSQSMQNMHACPLTPLRAGAIFLAHSAWQGRSPTPSPSPPRTAHAAFPTFHGLSVRGSRAVGCGYLQSSLASPYALQHRLYDSFLGRTTMLISQNEYT